MLPKISSRIAAPSAPLVMRLDRVGEARVGGEIGPTEVFAQVDPVAVGVPEEEQVEEAAVRRSVGLHRRVTELAPGGGVGEALGAGGGAGSPPPCDEMIAMPLNQMAVPSSEPSTTDATRRALALQQRRGDPPAKVMPDMPSPCPTMPVGHDAPETSMVDCASVPAAPPGDAVVTGALRLGPLGPLTAAVGVDDVGVDAADVVDVDLQLPPCRRQVAGEEHVGLGRELVDDLAAFVGRAGRAPIERLPRL